MRKFEAAHALGDRTGESAALVTEQFAFEQTSRNRRAVELDESVRVASRTQIMHSARDQFLSGAGLPVNQDRGVGRCHDFDLLKDGAQHLAFPTMWSNFSSLRISSSR